MIAAKECYVLSSKEKHHVVLDKHSVSSVYMLSICYSLVVSNRGASSVVIAIPSVVDLSLVLRERRIVATT